MKLSSLQAFVAVADCGSIHAAARKLGVSQPALSKTLRTLEQELGVDLVTRTSRGTVTTAYGRAFLNRAQLVVREVARAQEEVEQLKGNLRGGLAISIPPASMVTAFPVALENFRRECPDVEVYVTECLQTEAIDRLRHNETEIAVAPISSPLPSHEFRSANLMRVEMVPVVRRSHPLVDETQLANLLNAPWLRLSPRESTGSSGEQIFLDNQLEPPAPVVGCESLCIAVSLIQNSDLVCMLPRPALNVPAYADSLAILPLTVTPVYNDVTLVCRADTPLTPAAQIMVTHIKQAVAQCHPDSWQGEL